MVGRSPHYHCPGCGSRVGYGGESYRPKSGIGVILCVIGA